MIIIIISDSHGNITNLKHVMGFANSVNAGAIIHCGDWNNIESFNLVTSYKIPLFSVLGNADIHEDIKNAVKEKYLSKKIENKKIGVIHNLVDFDFKNKVDILFCGHKHFQSEFIKNKIKVVNPGALENSVNFAVWDTLSNEVELINGNRWV